MKIRNKLLLGAAALMAVAVTGCDNNDEQFLKRNVRSLSFDYVESSQTFTIRATGDWKIVPTENWVSVNPESGVGDGVKYETVTVTCERNIEDERDCKLLLSGSGQKDVEIEISQRNGLFEFSSDVGAVRITGNIPVGGTSSAGVSIPYIKAVGNEQFTVKTTASGRGMAGLSVAPEQTLTTVEGDAALFVPITGSATMQGLVSLEVEVLNGSTSLLKHTVVTIASENVQLVKQDFNKFPWGGDCIGGKPGVETIYKGDWAQTAIDNPTASCSEGTNGCNGSGLTTTVRGRTEPAAKKLLEDIGMVGWLGYRNYMRPGYIQLGATSSTGNEFGSIVTPALDIPAGVDKDVLVSFKVALYNSPFYDFKEVVCAFVPAGNTTIGKVASFSLFSSKTYVPFDIPAKTWHQVSCVLPGADASKAVVIGISDNWMDGDSAMGIGRLYIDDIIVTY